MGGVTVVAFDCDGVLFDSIEANTTYYNRILSHFRRPPLSPEQFEYAHIHTGDEVIAHLFADEKASQAAGIPFVAFNNRSLSATYHIECMNDLKRLLDRRY